MLRALAFACLDFEEAADNALLDEWFASSAGGGESALAARHLAAYADADAHAAIAQIAAGRGDICVLLSPLCVEVKGSADDFELN